MPLNITCDVNNFVNNIEWTEEPIKYLGVVLTSNIDEFDKLNWSVKIEKKKKKKKKKKKCKNVNNTLENAEFNVLWKNNHHQNVTYITIDIYRNMLYNASKIYQRFE